MIVLGLRLRWLPSDRLSWRDLVVIVRQTPQDSALRRSVDPAARHTFELELLRGAEYSLRTLVWAKTKDAQHGRNAPEPARFPWDPPPARAFSGDVVPMNEMKRRLGW